MRRSALPERTGTTADGIWANGIWKATLESFRESVASAEPVPAGVSAAAISATLGVSLLQKVLEIIAKRKSFAGDPGRLASLSQAAREEAERLAHYADEDIAAYRAYMEARRRGSAGIETTEAEATRAQSDFIDVPLKAARSALSGLALCADAASIVRGAVAADLGTAAILLAGAVHALLLSVETNLRGLSDCEEAIVECREIGDKAARQLESVLRQVTGAAGPG